MNTWKIQDMFSGFQNKSRQGNAWIATVKLVGESKVDLSYSHILELNPLLECARILISGYLYVNASCPLARMQSKGSQ